MTDPHQLCAVPQICNTWRAERGAGAAGLWLPADGPFGSLQLELTRIVLGIDEANRRVASAFDQWQAGPPDGHARPDLDLENAVFLLRRTADKIISLHSVLSHREEHGAYPLRLAADSVNALLKHGAALDAAPFQGHLETLRTLNAIDNAHRHTLIDARLSSTRAHEPVIAALALRRDRLAFGPRFFHVPARALVEGFDAFYEDCLAWLLGWSARHAHKAAA